jgi:non-specific serine/threonine protein kinase
VSQATRDLLADHVAEEELLTPAGEYALKGFDRPETVYVVCHPSLPALPHHAAEVARGASEHNVPAAVTSLIGRSRELDGVSEALRRGRLVTLVGPGGAGKTRLAIEVGRRLEGCPDVRILATSRESLGIGGETVWRLDPLGTEDARRLFVERARQRRPDFVPSADMEATIAALCARLDHLPLAIELAAARIAIMSVAEILASLETRLDALGGASRSMPPRHRTVRAAIEWSHALLDLDEQRALRSLSVFAGGFDAGAAMAVAPGLTLEMLARLVEKSIVTVGDGARSRTCYRLLETIREFAAERLADAGELDAARERHMRHFSQLGDIPADGWLSTRALEVLDELEDDYGNVLAALEWAAASEPCAGRRLLFARRDLFLVFGQADGRRLSELLLARCPARDNHRVELLITAGLLSMLMADIPAATRRHQEAADLAIELDEPRLQGWAECFHGLAAILGGLVEQARPHLEISRTLLHDAGIEVGAAVSDAALGLTYTATGETDRARDLLERAFATQIAEGYRWGQAQAHLYLALTADAAQAGSTDAALHYREAVSHLRPHRDQSLLPVALVGQASAALRRDPARALKVAAAASSIRLRTGGNFAPFFRARAEDVRMRCEAALGDRAEAIWAQGSRLGADDAIALAFDTPRPRAATPEGVSVRELEVVRLVADGLTNKAIAAELHLSVRTVESHVRHVLAKVGLDNRTQLAAWARERV